MNEQVKLLSRPINFAVVQLPGRKFPGVVVQGDTLHSLVRRMNELARQLNEGELDEAVSGLEDVVEQLSEAVKHYEQICVDQGISLPYGGP